MRTSGEGLDLIKAFEGFAPEVYVCPAGWPTIGYGHVVRDGENFAEPLGEDAAEALLARDIAGAERAVTRLIAADALNQGRFDALVSFTFNLGSGALQASTLRRKANRGEHGAVPAEFRRWVFAGGRRLAGLVRRRAAEAEMYHAHI